MGRERQRGAGPDELGIRRPDVGALLPRRRARDVDERPFKVRDVVLDIDIKHGRGSTRHGSWHFGYN